MEYQEVHPVSPDRRVTLIPLAIEPRTHVTTKIAALHLGRKQQTLRVWACSGQGPLKPVRIYGRLAWSVSELKRVLGTAV